MPKEPTKSILQNVMFQPKQLDAFRLMESDHELIGFGGSRGGSKAMEISTYVPVTRNTNESGWKTMGEINVGDEVFSRDGSVTYVTNCTPIMERNCLEMVFQTGDSLVCDVGHLWETACAPSAIPEVRTAYEISRSIALNHIITPPQSISGIPEFKPAVETWRIIDARPVGIRSVRCISVDHPSGMYLVGRSFIPTHNSYFARATALIRRVQYPGTKALIFRRVYDQLWQGHIMKLMAEWPEMYKRCWSGENKALMMPGGGMVLFRYGDTQKDITSFKGQEYDDIFIDEADELEQESIETLFTTNRTVNPKIKPKKVILFNPGGISGHFLKRVFWDKDWTEEERLKKPVFVHSHAWDNIYWVRGSLEQDGINPNDWWGWPEDKKIKYLTTRSQYGRDLNSLPEEKRQAWLYGNFDVFSGQAFDEFSRPIHVIDPVGVPDWWSRWGANDPGVNDPGVWYDLASDQDGNVYVVKEFTFDDKIPFSKQAAVVSKYLEDNKIDWSYCVTGMDAFASHAETKESPMDYYMKAGISCLVKPDHGAGCRARRAAAIREHLHVFDDPNVKPGEEPRKTSRLKIFSTCKKLISTLPMLPTDATDAECYAECSTDHWVDALGYGLQSRHGNNPKPEKTGFRKGSIGEKLGDFQKILEERSRAREEQIDRDMLEYLA